MSALTVMLIGSGLQTGLVVLLAADKWVHKVTGAPPLESRVQRLEDAMTRANEQWSEKMGKLTTYMEDRRSELDDVRALASELSGELRAMRGFRRDDR